MGNAYIYLVFSKTGTWLARLIRVLSKIKYVHTSISFDGSFTRMYSFGRINPDNPFSGGFVEENLFAGVYQKFPDCECLIYRVRVTEEQFCTLQKKIKEYMEKRERLKYNFLGLLGVLLNRPLKRENYYFCSQFVAKILQESQVFDGGKAPELVRTIDLFSIPNKDILWEGFIKDYLPAVSADGAKGSFVQKYSAGSSGNSLDLLGGEPPKEE